MTGPGVEAAAALTSVRRDIAHRFGVIDSTIKRTHLHIWQMTRDLVLRVLDEHLGEVQEAPDGIVGVARRARVDVLRDFVSWAGEMPEKEPGAFQHNSLVEAAAAMADFYQQGRLDASLSRDYRSETVVCRACKEPFVRVTLPGRKPLCPACRPTPASAASNPAAGDTP